jgi:ribulose-bisphosphate carboxylase large chain
VAALAHVRRHCDLPIHGHRANYGAMARHPLLGMGFSAFQKVFRLAGIDHLHVGGFDGKFYETNEEVARSIRDCLTPQFGDKCLLPAVSSAQWAGTAVPIHAATGTADILHLAGGGIIAHPGGTAAGVLSMQQGWEAALSGTRLQDYAATHPELQAAIEKFGGRV